MSTDYAIEREVLAVVTRCFVVCSFADYCDENPGNPDAAGPGEDWTDTTPEDCAEVNAEAARMARAWWEKLHTMYPDPIARYLDGYDPDIALRHDDDPVRAWAWKAAMSAQGAGVFPGDDGEELPTYAGSVLDDVPGVELYALADLWHARYSDDGV